MKKFLTFLLLLLFSASVVAYSVEVGIDEVLIVDGSVVTFDASPSGSLIYLRVEGPEGVNSSVLGFGGSLYFNGVNYTIGRFDPATEKLVLHLEGNYSNVEVLRKKDFSVEVVEAFDTYTKLRVRWEGYYGINDTLRVYSNGILLKELSVSMGRGDEVIFTVQTPPSRSLVLSLGGITKNVLIEKTRPQVEVKRLSRDEKLHATLLNHGDGVNATVSLTSGGLTLEKREVYLPRGEEVEVAFERNPLQGAIVLNYGAVAQESFYFEPPVISVVSYSLEGDALRLRLKNEGGYFHGKVSPTSNSVVIGSPLSVELTLREGEEREVTFNLTADVSYVTVLISSPEFTTSVPLSLERGLRVEFVNDYSRAYLGGSAVYSILITGKGRVELGTSGLPDSVSYAFYYGQNEVKTLNVDGSAQLTLVVSLPSFPSGFRVEGMVRFNATVNGENYPLTLEVAGAGRLPVYGDNWLAKSNFTSETHYLGLPYHVVWRDVSPPYIFENATGEKIALLYGRYVRQGEDLKLHILSPYGEILHTSEAPAGRPDFLVFNESEFMAMVEGKGFFNSVLLVARYMDKPGNLTLSMRRKPFGEGLEVIVLNATALRGRSLTIRASGENLELRAYHFTLNSEREDFDPLGDPKKAEFSAKGDTVSGRIAVRSDEDFVAIVVRGTGEVRLSLEAGGTVIGASEVTTRWAYMAVLGLGFLLLLALFLEKKLG